MAALSPQEREEAIAAAKAKYKARLELENSRARQAQETGQRLCIDLSFDAAMSDKENR